MHIAIYLFKELHALPLLNSRQSASHDNMGTLSQSRAGGDNFGCIGGVSPSFCGTKNRWA